MSDDINEAKIVVYDMSGTQLKSYQLHHNGEGSLIINGGEYKAGMYIYVLIANGKAIDSKQMILTKN